MKQHRLVLTLAMLLPISWGDVAFAQQALPTAERPMQLSAFGAVSGVYTGLAGGKNFSITAGVDLGLPPFGRVRPTIEVRGTYPTDRGLVDSQKSVLAGLRVEAPLGHRIHPYGDFLVGRGEMNYRFGYLFNYQIYELTTTNVYSPGGGFDYDATEHWSAKVDVQVQRWGSAPTPSGTVWAKVATVGVVYRFGFEGRRRR